MIKLASENIGNLFLLLTFVDLNKLKRINKSQIFTPNFLGIGVVYIDANMINISTVFACNVLYMPLLI